MVPTMSILNPEYTFRYQKTDRSRNRRYDEPYNGELFSMENADCQKFMAEGLLRTMIKMDRLLSHSLIITRPEPT